MDEYSVDRRPTGSRTGRPRRARSFSADEITGAIRRWADRYGEPPTMADWEPARARRLGQSWRAERFENGQWPSVRVVRLQFGSFNAAIAAAGFVIRPAPSRLRPNLTGPSAITEAMLEWTRRYGDVPTMADWDPTRARRLGQDWRIARYHTGDWPSARSVALHFGSFAKALASAGLVPRERSTHNGGRQAEQAANRYAAAAARGAANQPGVADLATSLRALARARSAQDPTALHAALIDIAGSALAWAQTFGAE
jgi:hypothetical protein